MPPSPSSLCPFRRPMIPKSTFSFKKPSNQFTRVIGKVHVKDEAETLGLIGMAATVGGLIVNVVVGWSLYTLKTTGCGLPPSPSGSLGALEGISFLVVFGLI